MHLFTTLIAVIFTLFLVSPAVHAQGNNNNIQRLIDDLERNQDDLSRDINDLRRIGGRGEISRADLAEVSRRTRDALANIDNVRDDLINLDNTSRQ